MLLKSSSRSSCTPSPQTPPPLFLPSLAQGEEFVSNVGGKTIRPDSVDRAKSRHDPARVKLGNADCNVINTP